MVSSTHQTLSKNRRRHRSRIRSNSHHLRPAPTKKKGPKSYKDTQILRWASLKTSLGQTKPNNSPQHEYWLLTWQTGQMIPRSQCQRPRKKVEELHPKLPRHLRSSGLSQKVRQRIVVKIRGTKSAQSGGGDEDNGEYENGRGLGRGGDREGRSTVMYSSRERRSIFREDF